MSLTFPDTIRPERTTPASGTDPFSSAGGTADTAGEVVNRTECGRPA